MALLLFSLPTPSPCRLSSSLLHPFTSTSPQHKPILSHLPNLSFPKTLPPLRLSPTPKAPPLPSSSSSSTLTETTDFDFGEEGEVEEEEVGNGGTGLDSPWEGAVVYRRDASVTHLEYATTLERLGMGKISTELSRSRAAEMGIRIMPRRGVVDPLLVGGTPVLVSVDVTRKKKKLKLDGIVRTVITLLCNRCGEPVAECIFSNFTLLLTEEPIEEPDEINMGVLYGEDRCKTSGGSLEEEEDDDESLIDLDDRLYFPAEENELDISKQIRDIVHVEITINAICDAICKGLCLKCGTNLNKRRCSCNKEGEQGARSGPLKDLKRQMQQR